ncbi:MAG: peptidylprolyl isomerase [Thermodesulfovibrionia bacterium]|nr:peptidylprolyl isomerase [Thermodesulfovibrionia bacterium]
MKKPLLILFLILSASIFSGCTQNSSSDSPVLAKVGEGIITEDDFLQDVSRVPEWAREQFNGIEGKEKFLEELIKREVIYQEAKRMKLDNNKEFIEKVRNFEKMTLVSLILKKEVEDKVRVDDSEVKTFFDENAEKFTIGTEIKASHILVKTEEEATEIHEKIVKGESFAKLAKSHSIDKTSAEKGGDLGYFGQGKLPPEIERAALGLKPGEISKPIRTRYGFDIIKLVDIKKGDPANFEQTKESIRRQLLTQKKKTLFEAYVEKLQEQSTVEKNADNLAAISLPWGQTTAPQPPQSQTEPENK